MRVYFGGLMVFSAVFMYLLPVYFVFVITGFIHAYLLKPAAARVRRGRAHLPLINSRIVSPDPTADGWWTYGIIVVIQTVAIGFGSVGGEKISELSEQRRRSLLELEAALEENAGLHAQLVAQAREAGITDESQRIAGEIHDTIAQGLTGVITQLEAANQVKSDPAELQRRLDNATSLARESLAEARRSMRAILPAPLEGRHLPEATGRRGGALVVVEPGAHRGDHHRRDAESSPRSGGDHAAGRPGGAGQRGQARQPPRVGVTLSYMGDVVTIDVRDNGTGFVAGNGRTAPGRRRIRAHRHAAAGRAAGRHPGNRVRARWWHRGLCHPPRHPDRPIP